MWRDKKPHRHTETARRRAGGFLIWSLPVLFTLFLLFNFFQFSHNIHAYTHTHDAEW